jgi:hypothetical protein
MKSDPNKPSDTTTQSGKDGTPVRYVAEWGGGPGPDREPPVSAWTDAVEDELEEEDDEDETGDA